MSHPYWAHGIQVKGDEFEPFWRDYFGQGGRKAALVLATGFDPRATKFIETIEPVADGQIHGALHLTFVYDDEDGALLKRADKNHQRILEFTAPLNPTEVQLQMSGADHTGKGARDAFREAQKFFRSSDLTDIIVDINAMPTSVAMMVIMAALKHCTKEGCKTNLHVVVSHDPNTDHAIHGVNPDQDPGTVSGFERTIEGDVAAEMPGVWLAILGADHLEHMSSISNKDWAPDYICPVVPSPSRNLRRTDELLVEYGNFIASINGHEGKVPQNVLRVSEEDPFEAYEEMLDTIRQHQQSYLPLGKGFRVLLSSQSTKVLSIAGLLALFDAERLGYADALGFAFIESRGHIFDEAVQETTRIFYSLWLAGTPYNDS